MKAPAIPAAVPPCWWNCRASSRSLAAGANFPIEHALGRVRMQSGLNVLLLRLAAYDPFETFTPLCGDAGTPMVPAITRRDLPDAGPTCRQLSVSVTAADVTKAVPCGSEICAWEVEEAARLNKRVFPVICRPLDGMDPPHRLPDLNYIFLYAEPKAPGGTPASPSARRTGRPSRCSCSSACSWPCILSPRGAARRLVPGRRDGGGEG